MERCEWEARCGASSVDHKERRMDLTSINRARRYSLLCMSRFFCATLELDSQQKFVVLLSRWTMKDKWSESLVSGSAPFFSSASFKRIVELLPFLLFLLHPHHFPLASCPFLLYSKL